jgi:carbonic anhydrase
MAEHHAPALDPHDPRLVEVNDPADIFPELDCTAVGDLLRWHNLPQSRGSMPLSSGRARLLVSMCMDHRADLIIPNEFAYILRSAGGTLRDSDFEVQYAVAVGGVTEIALLAHTDCGMVGVSGKRAKFVDGLVARGGCTADFANNEFDRFSTLYEQHDVVAFVVHECRRLEAMLPSLRATPLLYRVADDKLLQIRTTP